MENELLISIIIPIYNSEKTLCNCIESILNQDYKKFELILVNDGSTDDSERICMEYEKKDSRVKFISQINSGVSRARNKGIELSNGYYVMFVDSDDKLNKNSLDIMMHKANKNKMPDLIIGGAYEILTDTFNELKFKKSNLYKPKYFLEDVEVVYPRLLMATPWGKLYKNSIINKENITFDEKLSWGEDTCFLFEFIKHASDILTVDDLVYFYDNTNKNSASTKFRWDLVESLYLLQKRTEQMYLSFNCSQKSLQKHKLFFSDWIFCIIKEMSLLKNNYAQRKKMYIKISREKYVDDYIKYSINKKRKLILLLIKFKFYHVVDYILKINFKN